MFLDQTFKIINNIKVIKQQSMKQRIIYSPKPQRPTNQITVNSNRSPKKALFPEFLSRETSNANVSPATQPSKYTKQFQNLKKLPEEAFSLRQTMNNKKIQQMFRAQNMQQQTQKGKLGDLLRQTMNHKSSKAITQKYTKELNTSNQNNMGKDSIVTSFKSIKGKNGIKITQSRSSTNLPESYRNLSQNQQISKKIDENKKFLQKLRKQQSQQSKDYLKNVVHRSPSYVDLDEQKQTEIKKKKKQQSTLVITPKVQKTQAIRLNSPNQDTKLKSKKNPENIQTLAQNSSKKALLSTNIHQKKSFLEEFQVGRKLGQGKFGIVNLARHKKTLSLFALKKIQKAVIKSHMMVDQLALQIRIQSCLSHRNILGMYGFFEDKNHLYIVLEYMDGGTLYEKLKKSKISQKQTAFIIKNIAQSIEYLHDLGIAHRDIKPQNVVYSNNVYKLCDFGWAAMCNERRKTYCGTFDYVAPEILQGVDYDMTVDLWCLGVMTFELLTGKAPFYHISRKQTMKKILNVENSNIVYPESMSQNARDFIDKLVRKNPQQRITASQALLHPFILNASLD